MKARFSYFIKKSNIIIVLAMTLIIIFIFSSYASANNPNLIICNFDQYSLYTKAIGQILPSYTIEQSDNKVYYTLEDGATAEAFDTQAIGALEKGIAKYWYPHYLATVIIAIDREQTDAIVNTWSDLLASKQEVGFFNTHGNMQMIFGAMAYGLEGKNYAMKKPIELLSSLHDNGCLKINSFESPIIICYDYQAINLIKNGRNIEIIIPKEGTFTYEKGLLSNINLDFKRNLDNNLIKANLRPLDEKKYLSLYPDKLSYLPAIKVPDYNHFARMTQNVSCLFERNVFHSKRFMSIDNREHIHFALIFIIIITIWSLSVVRRSMQKGISYSAFFTGIILIGWTLVRLIKYQNEAIPSLTRYLWYSFYIFQLSLPLVMLWMAWAIDKPENETFPPKWWRYLAIVIGILIIFVFTNDLHGQVFHLDLSRSDWGINYSYGFGYYLVLFVCIVNLIAVFIIMLQKSIRNPKKMGFIFPILIFILFATYTYKYIMRNPIIYQTDITIVTAIFTMLMFEASIHSGLIPVNTKYIDLFKHSPLKIQIIDNKGIIAIASRTANPINKDFINKLILSSPNPFIKNDVMFFVNHIPGGYAIWHEDISKLSQLHNEIKISTQMLTEANAMLAEEEKLKRIINEENAKKILMEQLEIEITKSTEQLSKMIDEFPDSENHSKETTSIALLLCFIKRRCNLFFREKETNTIEADELIVYIDEIAEIADYSNLKIVTVNGIKGHISIRYATLFYDFFYAVIDLSVKVGCNYIVEHLGIEDDLIIMRVLASEDIRIFKPEVRLIEAVTAAKGKILTKNLEDTIGISLSFPNGGVTYD